MKLSRDAETERRTRETALDETLSATFPASDALSTLPNPDSDSIDTVVGTDEREVGGVGEPPLQTWQCVRRHERKHPRAGTSVEWTLL